MSAESSDAESALLFDAIDLVFDEQAPLSAKIMFDGRHIGPYVLAGMILTRPDLISPTVRIARMSARSDPESTMGLWLHHGLPEARIPLGVSVSRSGIQQVGPEQASFSDEEIQQLREMIAGSEGVPSVRWDADLSATIAEEVAPQIARVLGHTTWIVF